MGELGQFSQAGKSPGIGSPVIRVMKQVVSLNVHPHSWALLRPNKDSVMRQGFEPQQSSLYDEQKKKKKTYEQEFLGSLVWFRGLRT